MAPPEVPPGIPPELAEFLDLFFNSGLFPVLILGMFLYKLMPSTDPVLSLEQVKRKKPQFTKRHVAFKTDLKCVVGDPLGPDGKTKLKGTCGRQVWRPQGEAIELPPFSAAENPNSADLLFRQLQLDGKKMAEAPSDAPSNVASSLFKAVDFYQMLQSEDGSWQGDYGGPMFLLPGLVIVCYITGHDLGASVKEGMVVYLRNHQQIDGGWGMHIEEASTMFGTVMNYVALRLLGVSPKDDVCMDARAFIRRFGGATLVPSWGKFYLAVLNVYDWRGVDSVPPEMWCLPRWFPFHPGRTWVHCRMVYLPMSYLFGKKFQAPLTPLTKALREELYLTPYAEVSWSAARGAFSPLDVYHPPSVFIRGANYLLSWLELLPAALIPFRARGLAYAIDYVHAEDAQTDYCCIGPVNKVMNMLCVYAEDPTSHAYYMHTQRIEDYLWVAEDGVKMAGYIGSQTWDTSFAIQGLCEAGLGSRPANQAMVQRAYHYFTHAQNTEEVEDAATWWRGAQKGGWGFGPAANGYPVTDCTGEALKSMLLMEEHAGDILKDKVPVERYREAVDFMLALQNPDGGFPTYEKSRGYEWYEYLNPAVVFGGIMIDYSYIECTSTSMCALLKFTKRYPEYRPEKIRRAVKRADTFLRNQQYVDGSFFGKWGVCFTYGTWFAVVGMRAHGATEDDEDVRDAVKFLCSKQREDGGWSEAFGGCVSKRYLETDESQVVTTAWALLGLMRGIERKDGAQDGFETEWAVVRRGIQFLMAKQQANGDWDQQRISGVFNRSCGITYTAFRNLFPFWALGLYHKLQPGQSV